MIDMVIRKAGNGVEYKIQVIRSRRKSMGLQIKEAGVLIVRAPFFVSDAEIEKEVTRNKEWIEYHMQMVSEREKRYQNLSKFSEQDIKNMAEKACEIIPPKVEKYAKILGVRYGGITIRNQKTRWGSCSAKGNLNFNCLLTKVPEEVMDYVVVHELCHLKEMNHSKAFWSLVEGVMPDYRQKRNWLKEHGGELIHRMYT